MPTQVNLGHVVGPTGPTGPTGPAPIKGIDYWTEEEQSAIVEEAAQEAAALVNGNVPKRTVTDLVAHGEDAYAQKPIEVRVKGKTWVNRWPVLEGTQDGLTIATDETGLITVSGTATATGHIGAKVSGLAENKSISAVKSGGTMTVQLQAWNAGAYVRDVMTVNTSASTTNIGTGFDAIYARINYMIGETYNVSFRVMLVDGTEAPDCFTPPASITSVQAGKLVTSGKNLLDISTWTKVGGSGQLTVQPDGSWKCDGYRNFGGSGFVSPTLPPGSYHVDVSNFTDGAQVGLACSVPQSGFAWNNVWAKYDCAYVAFMVKNFTFVSSVSFQIGIMINSSMYGEELQPTIYVYNPQLELGSTATSYEPLNITETPLPEVELRSLPNGTCDELAIRADGTCEVERVLKRFDSESEWGTYGVSRELAYIQAVTGRPNSSWNDLISELPVVKELVADDTLIAPHWASNGAVVFFRFPTTEASDLSSAIEYMKSIGAYCYAQVPMTTEPQSPVTLPTLPAPTFNQYHDSPIPSDTSTQYARDINIVLSNLEAVQTALLGGE